MYELFRMFSIAAGVQSAYFHHDLYNYILRPLRTIIQLCIMRTMLLINKKVCERPDPPRD